MRRIADLKSRLQRTNPVEHPADYNRMFGELVALEQHRRTLRDRAVGQPREVGRTPPADVDVAAGGEGAGLGRVGATGDGRRRHARRGLRRDRRDRPVPWEQVEAADWDRDT